MKRLGRIFRRGTGPECALIAYVTCGDPGVGETIEIIRALIDAGADAIELGVPFSDPIADGPVIQAAAQRALKGGTTVRDLFGIASAVRDLDAEIPLIAFSYLNPILSLGPGGSAFEVFAKEAERAGIDALLLTDLPPEASREARTALHARGVGLVPLVAPTSPPERVRKIARAADGFIYYVSTTGVTGARAAMDEDLLDRVRGVRALTPKPIAVGFGVSSHRHFVDLCGVADGVVVGSAIVRAIAEGPPEGAGGRAAAVVRQIRGEK